MAAELVGGVLLGEGVRQCVKTVTRTKNRALKFQAILKNLENTINSLNPKLKEINQLIETSDDNCLLDDGIKNLIVISNQAKALIAQCSRIAWWNYCKKIRYSKRLLQLDESLRKIVDFDLQVEQTLIMRRIWEETRAMSKRLEELEEAERQSGELLCIVSGLQRLLTSMPEFVAFCLSSFFRNYRRGYRRITGSFCPKLW